MGIWTDCKTEDELHSSFVHHRQRLALALKDQRSNPCPVCGSTHVKKKKDLRPLKKLTQSEHEQRMLEAAISVELELANGFLAAHEGHEDARNYIKHVAQIAYGRKYWTGLSPDEQADFVEALCAKIRPKLLKTTGKPTDSTKRKAQQQRELTRAEYLDSSLLDPHNASFLVRAGYTKLGPEWKWLEEA